jgi:hypothetical protein
VQDKTIWLKTSEAGLVEAGSNPSLESLCSLNLKLEYPTIIYQLGKYFSNKIQLVSSFEVKQKIKALIYD